MIDKLYLQHLLVKGVLKRETDKLSYVSVVGADAGKIMTFTGPDPARESWLEETLDAYGIRSSSAQFRIMVFGPTYKYH
jgi:hypothetical protein